MLGLNEHLCVQAIAERFKVVKTSIIPGVAGSVRLPEANDSQTKAEAAEMRGIPYRESSEGTYVDINYDALR